MKLNNNLSLEYYMEQINIQKVKWKSNYSVNNKHIDEQHQKLFEILNILIDNKDVNIHSRIITDTLLEMLNYAEYHFSTEEKYMLKFNYPSYNEHKKEHMDFIKKTSLLSLRAMENDETIPLEILIFLNDWLVSHILKSDLELSKYFLDPGIM